MSATAAQPINSVLQGELDRSNRLLAELDSCARGRKVDALILAVKALIDAIDRFLHDGPSAQFPAVFDGLTTANEELALVLSALGEDR